VTRLDDIGTTDPLFNC